MSALFAGRYRIVRQLGGGGAAEVHEAEDLAARGRRVALKIARAGDPAAAASLLAELRALRQLHARAIPRALDFGSTEGRPYLSRTLIEGEPIDRTPRPWRTLAPLAYELLQAVAHLHDRGLVHGDLKAANVLASEGSVALIDLGLAASAGVVRAPLGTPGHLAPELLRGGALTPASDLWALAGLLEASLDGGDERVPSHVREVLARARRERPEDRFESARAFWDALRGSDPELGPLGAPAPSAEVALVGWAARVDELAVVLGAPGARVLVGGPAGAGKTRLVREVGWTLQAGGRRFLWASAAEGSAALLAATGASGAGAVGPPGLAAALVASACREGPAILHVDDLDRAAPSVLELVACLARTVSAETGLCLVVSGRTGTASPAVQVHDSTAPPSWERALPGMHRVELGELDEVEAGALLEAAGVSDPRRRADLCKLAGRRPGALLDAARGLSRRIGAAARERLAELDDRQREGVLALAFANGSLPLPCLPAAEALEDRGLVEPAAPGRVRLANARLGEALLESAAERRAAATAAREALARPADLTARDHLIAGRALATLDEPDGGARLLAAARALAEADPALAATAAAEALERLGGAERSEALAIRISAALAAGDVASAARAARDAAAPPLAAAAALLRAGDDAGADHALARALAAARTPEERAQARVERARLAQRRGRAELALHEAEAGLAERDASVATRTGLLLAHGLALGALGRDDEALAAADRAVRESRASGDARAAARALNHRAIALQRLGRRTEALEAHREAAREAARADATGASAGLATYVLNLGAALYYLFRLEEAERETLAALRLARQAGRAATEASARLNLAGIYVARGQIDRAAEEADEALAAERERPQGVVATAAILIAGDVARARGETAVARQRYEEAERRHATAGRPREAAEARLRRASLALDEGRTEEAKGLLSAIDPAAGSLGDQAATFCLCRGRLARLQGADPRAELEPLLGAEQPDVVWEAALELGEHYLGRQATHLAREHFARAAAILERAASDLPPDVAERFWSVRHRARARAASGATAPPPVASAAAGAPAASTGREIDRALLLLELNARIAGEQDVGRLLEAAIDTAVDVLGAERGFLLVRSGDALEVRVARNIDREAIVGPQLKWSRNIAEEVFRSREPIVTVDAMADGRLANAASVHAMRLRSILCLPVVAAERAEGVLYVDHRFQAGAFGDDAVRMARALSDQLAVALVNARRIAELRTRTTELEAARTRVEELLASERARAAERESLLEDVSAKLEDARRDLEARYARTEIVGRGPAMRRVFDLLDRVIPTDVTVLVTGESGTGKEQIARAIHALGPRREGRFVAVNCGAIPESLLESELFGHVRGAFSGAVTAREGLFVAAHRGTLLLDEVGDMPASMQVKLLRVLQDGEVRPVGGQTSRRVDVRLIAATQHPLDTLVARGHFRADLLYRLRVVGIELPPLRDRLEDVPALVEHFLQALSRRLGRPLTISPEGLRVLLRCPWPGNIRELENTLERAAVVARSNRIEPADLELDPSPGARPAPAAASRSGRRDHLSPEAIRAALAAERGHRGRAARRLGISRVTLFRRMRDLGVT